MSSSVTSTSNSLSGFLTTLVLTLPLAALYLAIFLFFRARAKRVYEPRAILSTYREHEKSPQTSDTIFGWVMPFWKLPDEYVLSSQGMDSYLYLRFFKVIIVICFVGCCISWPILFPVNATGPGGQHQLDRISFSNVPNSGGRYWAHTIVAWIFFGFVMFVVAKESLFFIKLRQAYLLSPAIESRMSNRTVLFTDIPEEYLTEHKLRALFPQVRYLWPVTDTKELDKLIKEREKTSIKLEGAEVKLSKQANKRRLKAKDESQNSENPDRWLEGVKRPTHRLKPVIGKKVDTIDWSRTHLGDLTPDIERIQASHWANKEKYLGAAFIEFETVSAAEGAFQQVVSHNPKYFQARAIGQRPDQIIYKNISMTWWKRDLLGMAVTAFICALIIFWAIPVAVIGAISNINYLTEKVHWLSFINDIPSVILGVVTGLLPTVMLAVLMSLVPIIMRLLAKLAGAVSTAEVELKTQNYYFWFNVIQIFLVVTIGSAATAAAAQIAANPASAVTLLATSLPKASNFYIEYFVLYGIALSTKSIAQVIALAFWAILSKILDTTPRKQYNRYIKVSSLGWGSTYPVYTNLAVIALTYSCIAPLVLGFATIGISLLYIVFRYNVIYALDSNAVNTQGRNYAMALQHLTTGVYLGELCLIGLFAINTAGSKVSIGPLILMVIALIFTILFHISMRNSLRPLMTTLPRDLMMQNMKASTERLEAGEGTDKTDPEHDDYNNRLSTTSTKWMQPTSSDYVSNNKKRSLVQRLIHPSALPAFAPFMSQPIPEYSDDVRREAYLNPSITSPVPIVWIVHDEMGISAREKAESGKVVGTSDAGAWWEHGSGKLVGIWSQEGHGDRIKEVPIYRERVDY